MKLKSKYQIKRRCTVRYSTRTAFDFEKGVGGPLIQKHGKIYTDIQDITDKL